MSPQKLHCLGKLKLKLIPYDPKKSDIWSLGVTFFTMTFFKFPWNKDELIDHYQKNLSYPPMECPQNISNLRWDFIRGLLAPKEEDRFTLEQAMLHPWLLSPPQ